jgi:hypothetical protein
LRVAELCVAKSFVAERKIDVGTGRRRVERLVVLSLEDFDAEDMGLERRKAKAIRRADRRLDFDERADPIHGVQLVAQRQSIFRRRRGAGESKQQECTNQYRSHCRSPRVRLAMAPSSRRSLR